MRNVVILLIIVLGLNSWTSQPIEDKVLSNKTVLPSNDDFVYDLLLILYVEKSVYRFENSFLDFYP